MNAQCPARKLHHRWTVLAVWVAAVGVAEPLRLAIPRGLDEFIPIPKDNALTNEKVQLGKRLFFDQTLSRDGTVSCGTCHRATQIFTLRKPVATGVDGRAGRRNVPTLFNRAYQRSFSWDGRESSLERQVLRPFGDPLEMDLLLGELERRLNQPEERLSPSVSTRLTRTSPSLGASLSDDDGDETPAPEPVRKDSVPAKSYRKEFEAVFGEPPTALNAAKALASYVRMLIAADSAFDRFQHGDSTALSESAQRGLKFFRGRGNCTSCHSGPLLSDEEFHNTGVSWAQQPFDLGRFEVTGRESDRGRFKTPSLRDVELTAPYMHNGSLAKLNDVVEFYSRGGNPNPNLDREIRPLTLSPEEKTDLVEFLKALSGNP